MVDEASGDAGGGYEVGESGAVSITVPAAVGFDGRRLRSARADTRDERERRQRAEAEERVEGARLSNMDRELDRVKSELARQAALAIEAEAVALAALETQITAAQHAIDLQVASAETNSKRGGRARYNYTRL